VNIPILMYHSVSDISPVGRRLWTISPTTFASHLEYLKSQDYVPLTVSAFVSLGFDLAGPLPVKPVILTFDDGLADFYTGSLPLLDRYGFPATLYIPTAYVNQSGRWIKPSGNGNYPMLSWSEVREIADRGIECGSHGHSHTQLDILPIDKMKEEVRNSKDLLEQHLQKRVESIAYPYGLNSKTLRQIVRQTGYSSGCAIQHSMASLTDDRFALARIVITSELSQTRYQDIIMGKGLHKSHHDERMRTKIYRFARKLKSRTYMG
jgi:peptidoglycan/xylan/chitin deacetylase (PgdA/CDA1 family)